MSNAYCSIFSNEKIILELYIIFERASLFILNAGHNNKTSVPFGPSLAPIGSVHKCSFHCK